jgi:hypothetical protein
VWWDKALTPALSTQRRGDYSKKSFYYKKIKKGGAKDVFEIYF